MNLPTAQRYAEHLKTWIAPLCSRVEIAGSVRRLRPVCNDVDLVCIPKLEAATTDLLGEETEPPKSLLRDFLMRYVAEKIKLPDGQAAWFRSSMSGHRNDFVGPETVNFLLQLPRCELDVFAANEATFATRFLIRTGSKEHNIWIAQRAQRLGGRLDPQSGLWMGDVHHQPKSEEEFYAVIDLPFIPPAEREIHLLTRRFGG